jgi:hypothetical protein
MVVADAPHAAVWEAALGAVEDYPIERAADGWIVTGWRERVAGPEETGFDRIRERVTLRVEAYGERVTRVTVELEAQGSEAGRWVALPDAAGRARRILAAIRERQG